MKGLITLIFLFTLLFLGINSFAQDKGQTYNSVQSGNWTDPATWDKNDGFPDQTDKAIINNGHTITLDTDIPSAGSQSGISEITVYLTGSIVEETDVSCHTIQILSNCDMNLYGNATIGCIQFKNKSNVNIFQDGHLTTRCCIEMESDGGIVVDGVINISGDVTVNGAITGEGTMVFSSSSTTFSGTGSIYNIPVSDFEVNTTIAGYTWYGDLTNDWATNDNWYDQSLGVPIVNTDFVSILKGSDVGKDNRTDYYDPVIDEDVTIENLTVNSGNTITVASGSTLTVNDVISNDGEIILNGSITVNNLTNTGTIIIKSDATGTGSLIVDNITNTGTIISEHYLPGDALAWHEVSSSMDGNAMISGNHWSSPSYANDFYAWDEPSPGTWVNYQNGTTYPTFTDVNGSADYFVPGKGYLIAFDEANPTNTISGDLCLGTVPFTLSYNPGKDNWIWTAGWNLLGNPYSAPIDWSVAVANYSAVLNDNFAYMYDPNKEGGADYVYIDGGTDGAIIAPGQGFFVQAIQDESVINFTENMREHGSSMTFKSSNEENALVLRLSNDEYYNETKLLEDSRSENIRDKYDAVKFFSYDSNVPMLFSYSNDNTPLAINSIPDFNTELSVILGMRIPEDDNYFLNVTDVPLSLSGTPIYIEDSQTGNWNRVDNGSMEIFVQAGDIYDRYVLHMGAVGINGVESNSNIINAWYSDGQMNIIGQDGRGEVNIFDISGQLVYSENTELNVPVNINVFLSEGVYIVKLLKDRNVFTGKVLVK